MVLPAARAGSFQGAPPKPATARIASTACRNSRMCCAFAVVCPTMIVLSVKTVGKYANAFVLVSVLPEVGVSTILTAPTACAGVVTVIMLVSLLPFVSNHDADDPPIVTVESPANSPVSLICCPPEVRPAGGATLSILSVAVVVTRSYPMTSRLMPSGDVAVTSANCPAQLKAFWTYGFACGHAKLSQSPKSPVG